MSKKDEALKLALEYRPSMDTEVLHSWAADMKKAAQEALAAERPTEILGEQCIDGGKCHHQCENKCFRRECCEPFSGYVGPWSYPKPSPTAGMNIAERILHVGGRNNAAGYVEFGSIQAVEALINQVLRDLPAQEKNSE